MTTPKQIAVITDSASDLDDARLQELGVDVVPLSVRFGDEEFVDKIELSREEFWRRADTSEELPGTAAPSPGAFAEAFTKAKSQGAQGVVCVTLSAELSATFQSARGAAQIVKDDIDVRVVDSKTCTVGQARIVEAAALAAQSGSDLNSVEATAKQCAANQKLFGALNTLENLRKGGRIGAAGAFFATLLSVKPLITIEEGVVKPVSKQRTRSKSLRQLANIVLENAPVEKVGVCDSCADDVDEFIEMLKPAVAAKDVLRCEMGPTIGVHGGKGLIAVTFAPVTHD